MTHVCAHIRFSVQLKVHFRDENVHGCFCIRPREKKSHMTSFTTNILMISLLPSNHILSDQ